jgi:glucose-1-phosphate cytidylyltransferase
MKAVVFAGGSGTRIRENSAIKPKPMIEIGYKGQLIKDYFANYFLGRSDVRFDLKTNNVDFLSNHVQPRPLANPHTDEDGECQLAHV